jgi:hypothetical protein
MTLESSTNKKIKTILDKYGSGILSYRPVPSQYGARFVDYILCVFGHYTIVESKRPGKRPTEHQKTKLEAAYLAGGAAMFIDGTPRTMSSIAWLEAWIIEARQAQLNSRRPQIPVPNWR